MIYTGYFDGASRGNPGEAAIGAYLINDKGEIISEISQRIGSKTNNEAEYMALITLLEEVKRRDIKEAKLYGDSQLVINQVSGKWRINHLHLYDLCEQVLRLIQGMRVTLIWIPREENAYADSLSNQAFSVEAKKRSLIHQIWSVPPSSFLLLMERKITL